MTSMLLAELGTHKEQLEAEFAIGMEVANDDQFLRGWESMTYNQATLDTCSTACCATFNCQSEQCATVNGNTCRCF
jgi:hypothetical protein